ncbi:MAG: hypothetical protein CMF52_07275 [Legionellales bacterium]|nr:hypothetical protein [Legionellales bacterium]
MNKNYDKIAAIEKAISEKYGEEAIINPQAEWTEEKEKEYSKQAKELYNKNKRISDFSDKIDVNGIKVSKKLLNRESLRTCPVCGSFPKNTMDDVCLVKFQCCNNCYIKFVEGREERWLSGWRPEK